MLRRLLSRVRPRFRERNLEREAERREAERLNDAITTERAYARFGPRNALPEPRRDD